MLTFLLITFLALQSSIPDTSGGIPPGPFLKTIRIVHNPEEIMFINRPYDLELFVNFPQDSLESVSLFLKTNNMERYREIPLTLKRGRYSFRYLPDEFPGKSIQYFFVVRLENYAVFATPLHKYGFIKPVKKTFVDPVQYYKWKHSQNR